MVVSEAQLAKCPDLARKTIMFIIERSTNDNVVVYEGMLDASKDALVQKAPVDVYWQDIDDEYLKASKAKGKPARAELNAFERKMAYGLSCSDVQSDRCSLKLVALPQKSIDVVLETDETDGSRVPRAITDLNGRRCYLEKIFVEARSNMFGLPKVVKVQVTGIDVDRSETVVEIINP